MNRVYPLATITNKWAVQFLYWVLTFSALLVQNAHAQAPGSIGAGPGGGDAARQAISLTIAHLGLEQRGIDWTIQSPNQAWDRLRLYSGWRPSVNNPIPVLEWVVLVFGSAIQPVDRQVIILRERDLKNSPWKEWLRPNPQSALFADNLVHPFGGGLSPTTQNCQGNATLAAQRRKFLENLAEIGKAVNLDSSGGRIELGVEKDGTAFVVGFQPTDAARPLVASSLGTRLHQPLLLEFPPTPRWQPFRPLALGTAAVLAEHEVESQNLSLLALGTEGAVFVRPDAATDKPRYLVWRREAPAKLGNTDPHYSSAKEVNARADVPRWLRFTGDIPVSLQQSPLEQTTRDRCAALSVCSPLRWRDDERHPVDPALWIFSRPASPKP